MKVKVDDCKGWIESRRDVGDKKTLQRRRERTDQRAQSLVCTTKVIYCVSGVHLQMLTVPHRIDCPLRSAVR